MMYCDVPLSFLFGLLMVWFVVNKNVVNCIY